MAEKSDIEALLLELWEPSPEMLRACVEAIDRTFGVRQPDGRIVTGHITWSEKHTARWQAMLRNWAKARGVPCPPSTLRHSRTIAITRT